MSFRNRLTLFLVAIVIVPMVVLTFVFFRLVSDSAEGKGNARLGQAQRTAQRVYVDASRRTTTSLQRIGSDIGLATAIASRNRQNVQRQLEALADQEGVVRATAEIPRLGTFEVNRTTPALEPAATRLVNADRERVGRLRTSVLSTTDYVRRVKALTGVDVAIASQGRTLATTLEREPTTEIPPRGEFTADNTDYRVSSFRAAGYDGTPLAVHLLSDREQENTSVFAGSSILIAFALIGFLLLAFALAVTVSRSLQSQVQRLLDAARRLGTGDFRIQVPTEGNDEFAALGSEFNAMARQLESRLEELQQERARLQGAIRRVGESFAKGLDRDALLDIVVQTAVDGVGADCGRATVRAHAVGPPVEVARAGDLVARKEAIHSVETSALRTRAAAEATTSAGTALAQPLRSSEGDHVLGVISVARNGDRPFTDPEKELFNYLASQAAVSIENVDLHETVQRQAVTDELTGLFNHRRFQEVMALEIERTRRFGSDMGLIMLDIDNFKKVNDTYGHMQGDLVLREVAQVLRDSAREIDEPARYGGEEMAVALPQTDLEGAYQFAERVRRRIESLELPILEGDGKLRVTASFGAAALGGSNLAREADKEALVAAADAALYRAKRSGKNRTVKAE